LRVEGERLKKKTKELSQKTFCRQTGRESNGNAPEGEQGERGPLPKRREYGERESVKKGGPTIELGRGCGVGAGDVKTLGEDLPERMKIRLDLQIRKRIVVPGLGFSSGNIRTRVGRSVQKSERTPRGEDVKRKKKTRQRGEKRLRGGNIKREKKENVLFFGGGGSSPLGGKGEYHRRNAIGSSGKNLSWEARMRAREPRTMAQDELSCTGFRAKRRGQEKLKWGEKLRPEKRRLQ